MMYDCAGRSFIMLLNTRYLCNLWQQARTHRPWSDNPIAKTRTSSCSRHSRGQTQTGTRIQTHQNLFTLTKNILFLNIEAGNKHPGSVGADLCRNRAQRKPKLDFPHKRSDVDCAARRRTLTTPTGGDGRNRTDDPLLAKQVLYQLSYIPGSKQLEQRK
jgi:hypothetical protein